MNTMELLPNDLMQRLEAQEANPYHIPEARQALEEALMTQFRAVAKGLSADRLLRGWVPDDDEWWYQYASLHEPLASPPQDDISAGFKQVTEVFIQDLVEMPWEEAQLSYQTQRQCMVSLFYERAAKTDRGIPGFQAFRDAFPLDVVLRRVKRIAPADTGEIRIRIYGGSVDLWQEGRINRQLRDLGSSMRYCIEGARDYRMRRVRSLIGLNVDGTKVPPGFVLGEASPVSAVGCCAFVELVREFAVSPYLGAAPGYSEGIKAVVRRVVPLRLPIDPGGHELGHAVVAPDQGSQLASLPAVLREDICRYCQIPRKLGSIAYQFSLAFGSYIGALGHGFPLDVAPEKPTLHLIIKKLCEDELLVVNDGEYYCPLFEDGRRWHLA